MLFEEDIIAQQEDAREEIAARKAALQLQSQEVPCYGQSHSYPGKRRRFLERTEQCQGVAC